MKLPESSRDKEDAETLEKLVSMGELQNMMKVLCLAEMYPNSANAYLGSFIHWQNRALREKGIVNVKEKEGKDYYSLET
jgi:hypothetical protein